MRMLDCPTSVVHRLADDDADEASGVDTVLLESRHGTSRVAQVETYLLRSGPAHAVEIAARLAVPEPTIERILSALKSSRRAVVVDRVELPPAPGSKRRVRLRSKYALLCQSAARTTY